MDPILKPAWSAGIKVLEDCAQATGAGYHGKPLGSFGDATYYTFGLTKNITTLRGGMVTTNDDSLADYVRSEIRTQVPLPLKPIVKEILVGTAMMTVTDPRVYPFTLYPVVRLMNQVAGRDVLHEMFEEEAVLYDREPAWFKTSGARGAQAAVGLVQLKRIDRLNGMRAAHGQFLLEHLSHATGIRVPRLVEGAEPIFMSFPIQVENRDRVAKALMARGVDTTSGFMRDCSTLPLFEGKVEGACPVAKRVEEHILHIPVHPNLDRRALEHLVESVRRAVLS